ncbi:MAG: 3-phosphoshikimate 1-carboxyvinyltransferase [Actinomycetota bacterium]|nr:3-phosphoshikimate 1-carboxyvinyltransferase [Actinomycetota bacterium]
MKAVVTAGKVTGQRLSVPGDKSISHRALLLGLLSEGQYRVFGLSRADDVMATYRLVEALGVEIASGSSSSISLTPASEKVIEPKDVLDVGNSGTLIRLASGILAHMDGATFFLNGDASIRRRPMARVTQPLRLMGAEIYGRDSGNLAPLAIVGKRLKAIEYRLPVASAQVKSAVIFGGLGADGTTVVEEIEPTRSHTEEMLLAFGADLSIERSADAVRISVAPSQLRGSDIHVPGDPSSAAFFIALGLMTNCQVGVDGIYLGPQRDGFIDILKEMGAKIEIVADGKGSFDVTTGPSRLHSVATDGHDAASYIDEVPIIATVAAICDGISEFRGLEELRHKESDRIKTTLAMLRSFGVECGEHEDGLFVVGNSHIQQSRLRVVDAHFDHRIAMSASILTMALGGSTEISGFDSVATSFPTFVDLLRSVGGSVEFDPSEL